jgi:hypothetical protein
LAASGIGRAPSFTATVVLADNPPAAPYINRMRTLLVLSLFMLLAAAAWFAVSAWMRFGGAEIPLYGYIAIAGGVLVSLLVGGGLMALTFYSSRHGYDDLDGGGDQSR